jgi:hypothetical protein
LGLKGDIWQVEMMQRGSSNPPRRPAETPANLRVKAARARRLAEGTDSKTEKMTEFAQELETKAAELEQQPTPCHHKT